MKHLLTFKLFERNNSYIEGDIVLINYWAINEPIPVKIVSIKGNMVLISFTVSTSPIQNAPNVEINKRDIIGKYYGVDEPATPTSYSNDKWDDKFQKISNDMVNPNIPLNI